MNVLLNNISSYCREHVLDEKWLLAPTLRAGGQWLESVSRGGQPLLNLRVKTFKGLVLDLAGPELASRELKLLSNSAGEILADRAWSRLASGKTRLKYLAALQPGRSLPRVLYQTLNALRLAGLASSELRPRNFEVGEKAADLARLLDAYTDLLRAEHRADYAQALMLAHESLEKNPDDFAPGVTLLIPNDLGHSLRPGEGELLERIPESRRVDLAVDEPLTPDPDGKNHDAALLRWLSEMSRAPKPKNDGTLQVFRASGEVNEVREVLRRCITCGIKLDEVEILHTDNDTYIPLLYELAERLGRWGESGENTLPITFAEGIPCRYFRPGRALSAWLSWMAEDFPQKTLVRMIQDGLLAIDGCSESEFSQLADVLRDVNIWQGRERYTSMLGRQIEALERQIAVGVSGSTEDDPGSGAGAVEYRSRQLNITIRLRDFVLGLLKVSPEHGGPVQDMLKAAETFLTKFVRCTTEFDNNARNALVIEVRELCELLNPADLFGGFQVHAWLGALPGRLRVGGSAPRPGCLHASHFMNGGHSGRPHTFIIGLDDARFPGAGLQDPLLLDSERHKISPEKLETSANRVTARTRAFNHMLARLRGSVTLGYSCRDLNDERETFPGSAILDAFRLLTVNPAADQRDLDAWLALPASFAPADPAQSLDESEWWLWRMHDAERIADPRNLVARNFPHLGRGLLAAQQRLSETLSEFDGLVPEAGRDLDPFAENGPVFSATRLETLGSCPLRYFFRYVLQIEPPEELELDPRHWLDSLAAGQLLHEVYRDYVIRMLEAPDEPVADEASLMNLLDRTIKAYAERYPAPSENVFQKECRDLQTAMRIFLHSGDLFSGDAKPLFVEASVGLKSLDQKTPLDTEEPVTITLPDRSRIRVCGRLDRVDRIGPESEKCFAVVDYKTGRAKKYSLTEPFMQGRVVQHLVYLEMSRAVLQKKFPGAKLAMFSFFFAGAPGAGERMAFTPMQLADGKQVLQNMCRMASSGAFLATDSDKDCKSCDYQSVCRDVISVNACSKIKLAHPQNAVLQPFRELRQKGGSDEPDSAT
jgi:hypothetical protein